MLVPRSMSARSTAGRSRPSRFTRVAAVLVVALLVPLACQTVRTGARCSGQGFGRVSQQVVQCRNRRWVRTGLTVEQVARFLIAVAQSRATQPTQPAQTGRPSLAVSTVVSNLEKPWDLAFDPTGTMFFTEKNGRINALVGGVRRTLADPADSVSTGESGMMGLALDPQFATNRRLYVCTMSNITGGLDTRVLRFTVSPDTTGLTDRADIVTGLPVNANGQTGRHGGCRPRFGPDGSLWIGTGDAATGSTAQNPSSLGGKVLRVTTDGGGAPGNPGGALDPRIYTLGHRNVQGLAFRPGSSQVFSVEHGTGRDDEVNRLVPGGNYGWSPGGGSGGYDEGFPMTDPSRVPGARVATWSSGSSTIAPSGATFLSGPQWRDWNGALVLAVLKDTQLRVLVLDPDGNSVTGEDVAVTDQGRLRTAVQGPDGSLYVSTDVSGTGRILRVTPS